MLFTLTLLYTLSSINTDNYFLTVQQYQFTNTIEHETMRTILNGKYANDDYVLNLSCAEAL